MRVMRAASVRCVSRAVRLACERVTGVWQWHVLGWRQRAAASAAGRQEQHAVERPLTRHNIACTCGGKKLLEELALHPAFQVQAPSD